MDNLSGAIPEIQIHSIIDEEVVPKRDQLSVLPAGQTTLCTADWHAKPHKTLDGRQVNHVSEEMQQLIKKLTKKEWLTDTQAEKLFCFFGPHLITNSVFVDITNDSMIQALVHKYLKDIIIDLHNITPALPERYFTEALCDMIAELKPCYLRDIYLLYQNKNYTTDFKIMFYKKIACKKACNFLYIPPETQTDVLCRILCFHNNSDALLSVSSIILNTWGSENDPEMHQQISQYHPDALKIILELFMTFDLYKLHCQHYGISLKDVPFYIIDALSIDEYDELCQLSCDNNWQALAYVSTQKLGQPRYLNLCKKVLMKSGLALGLIDEALRTLELCTIACHTSGLAFKFVSVERIGLKAYLKLADIAASRNGHVLELIDPDLRTFKIHKIALKNNPWAIQYVNKKRIDDNLYAQLVDMVCEINGEVISIIPDKFRCESSIKKALRSNPLIIKYLNQKHLTEEMYTLACGKEIVLQTRSHEDRLDSIYYQSFEEGCQDDPHALDRTPENQITLSLYKIAYQHYGQIDQLLSNTPEQYLPELLPFILKYPTNQTLLYLITAPNNKVYIDPVLDWISRPTYDHAKPLLAAEELYSKKDNPLQHNTQNPCYQELLWTVFSDFQPPNRMKGQLIQSALNDQMTIKLQDDCDVFLENHKSIHIVGGRTLQMTASKDADMPVDYYKIQRKDESIDDFLKEAKMYLFLQDNSDIKIVSKIPTTICVKYIPLSSVLLNITKKLEDSIETHTMNGKRYVIVHHYQALTSYYDYAHKENINCANPCKFGESGILQAIFDVGLFMSAGVIPTSLLPAFHATAIGRIWLPLQSFFKKAHPDTTAYLMPGSLSAWNSTATERPDYGYDGLRDLGDIEFFGEINSYFNSIDTNQYLYPEPVMQRLAFINALCESILAAILLRSRLRQTSAHYHYKNTLCLEQTSRFVDETLSQFSQGWTVLCDNTHGADLTPSTLLSMTQEQYSQWLHRTAQEIVYWTAVQPDTLYTLNIDCYTYHANIDQQLSTTLYASAKPPFDLNNRSVNDHYDMNAFISRQNKQNLGSRNNNFPLFSLMKGLTRFSSHLVLAIKAN